MFEVDSFLNASNDYLFTVGKGGNQGGEGDDAAGEWWIEGMAEDLDGQYSAFPLRWRGQTYLTVESSPSPTRHRQDYPLVFS